MISIPASLTRDDLILLLAVCIYYHQGRDKKYKFTVDDAYEVAGAVREFIPFEGGKLETGFDRPK